ncbi:DUF2778 domain-containing protein [Methylobacterium trifolii]|nr:DUF2778 domain-containing protein [Methylobacterium trifolii]
MAAPPAPDDAVPVSAPPLGPDALRLWQSALFGSVPQWSSERPEAVAELSTPLALQESAPAPESAPPRLVQTVPLPVPRPPEFRQRRPERQAARRPAVAPPPAPKQEERSFLEALFGIERTPAPAPALSYAALERNPVEALPRQRLVPAPNPEAGGGIAIYDISARTVRLPSGEVLEAHSGLGETMDDPRYVHVRMRGATPPGTYDLVERENLFHGVRAIRLNPVGGPAAVYGRAGLLAHTYMLGPSGASNGCVSFKDYEKFLNAFLRGEVQRLVVVNGRGLDLLPSIANQGPAAPVRAARIGGPV